MKKFLLLTILALMILSGFSQTVTQDSTTCLPNITFRNIIKELLIKDALSQENIILKSNEAIYLQRISGKDSSIAEYRKIIANDSTIHKNDLSIIDEHKQIEQVNDDLIGMLEKDIKRQKRQKIFGISFATIGTGALMYLLLK